MTRYVQAANRQALNALILLAMGLCSASSAAQDLDAALRTAADSAGVPGAAWALVVGPDQWTGAVGMADREAGIPVTDSTVFRIASVSKTLVAAAAATAQAEALLDLNADLAATLPWLPAGGITMQRLLTHTAGLDDPVTGSFVRDTEEITPLPEYLQAHVRAPTTPPGSGVRYSNQGVAIAGHALGVALGVSFPEAMDRLLFHRLGMESTSFHQPPGEGLTEGLARAYRCVDCSAEPMDWRNLPPAGGAFTTAGDMAVFIRAALRDEPWAATLRRQHFAADPRMPGLALAFAEQKVAGHRALVHSGSSSGYASLLVLVPSLQAGFFLVASGGGPDFGWDALAEFKALISHTGQGTWLDGAEPTAIEALQEYVGAYAGGRASLGTLDRFPGVFFYSTTIGAEDGYLILAERGQWVRYGRIDTDLFRSVEGHRYLKFERQGGRVVAVHAASPFYGARYPDTKRKLPSWSAPRTLNEVVSWILGVPFLLVIAWLPLAGVLWLKRSRTRKPRPSLRWWIPSTILTASIVSFGFLFVARFNALVVQSPEAIVYGMPEFLTQWLWMPWLVLALTLAMGAVVVSAWRRRAHVLDRLTVSVVFLAGLAFMAGLVYFNLLPPVMP